MDEFRIGEHVAWRPDPAGVVGVLQERPLPRPDEEVVQKTHLTSLPWRERPRRKYRITSDFPLDIDSGSRRITAQGKLNGGGDLIRLRTTNGDIEIRKR